MYNNKNFYVKKNQLKTLAEDLFLRIYGCNFHKNSDDLKQINEARQHVIENMKPAIAFSWQHIKKITKKRLELENCIQLTGDFFSYFKKKEEKIEALIVSLATIGNIDTKKNIGLTQQFYIDAWGTAYLEALRILFYEYLSKEVKGNARYLSDSFGPGHYGIPLENLAAIFKLIDAASISVRLIDNKMISPDKSSAEMVLISSEPLSLQLNPCQTCLTKSNCMYCRFYKK